MKVDYDSVGVDTPEDVEWVERFLKRLEPQVKHR
jgi:CMP-2-keto-3-deoxyoctulosonic acid synthetase